MIDKLSLVALGATFTGAGFLGASALDRPGAVRFDEITVERINVVEQDGTIKMVIANRERQAAARLDGQEIMPDRQRPPGMIFFNERGDEIGGLVFQGDEQAQGGGFFFDQLRQDQAVGIVHESARRDGELFAMSGLRVWDRAPELSVTEVLEKVEAVRAIEDPAERQAAAQTLQESGAFGGQRLLAGRNSKGEATVDLADGTGRPRLRLVVDADGAARIEFLDADGAVLKTIGAR